MSLEHDYGWVYPHPMVDHVDDRRSAYVAKFLPDEVFAPSFYYRDLWRRIPDNVECSPAVALQIEDSQLVGVYYVLKYEARFDKGSLGVYPNLLEYEIRALLPQKKCDLVPCRVKAPSAHCAYIVLEASLDLSQYNYALIPSDLQEVGELSNGKYILPGLEDAGVVYSVVDLRRR